MWWIDTGPGLHRLHASDSVENISGSQKDATFLVTIWRCTRQPWHVAVVNLEPENCHVTHNMLLFNLIFTSGQVVCWPAHEMCLLREDGPLRAETFSSFNVNKVGRVSVQYNVKWCLITHGTIMQSKWLRTYIYYLTRWDYNKLHHNSSSLQLTTNPLWVFSTALIEILLPSSARRQFIHNEVKRISKNDFVKLRSVNLPAAVTNKISHVSKGLVDDLIKKIWKRRNL